MNRPAPFVWIGDTGADRLVHVFFRREVTLDAPASEAVLHLFAYTHYELRVNGCLVGFGPARSYPEFPEYDTYDLRPYLLPGSNVIAAQVVHMAVADFHHLGGPGGFSAWGEIRADKGETVSLSTKDGWLCHRSRGHDPLTRKFSFAIGPLDHCDHRLIPEGWDRAEKPEGEWAAPQPVRDDSFWGDLRPRSIPHLTQDEVLAHRLLSAHEHVQQERIFSFLLYQPYDYRDHGGPPHRAFAYTWIHSPKEQVIISGIHWTEVYLNGEKLQAVRADAPKSHREHVDLYLKEGWNFLFLRNEMVRDFWEFHLGLPAEAQLELSADRKIGSLPVFRVAGPMPAQDVEHLNAKLPPDSPDTLSELASAWRDQPLSPRPVSPLTALAWADLGEDLGLPAWKTTGLEIRQGQPTSLMIDYGGIQLARLFVELDAPEGTVLDFGYAEEMGADRPAYEKHAIVFPGERHITREGRSRVEFFFPRGFRYLQLAVSEHTRDVTIHRIGGLSQLYPYGKTGAFECSDPFFNTLWEYGYRTLQLCSEDVITDCPWRERTLYGGDLFPEAATALVTTGDMRLVRRGLEIFLQSYNPETCWLQSMAPMRRDRPPLYEYPLCVIICTDWYVRLTGDVEFAERAYPIFRSMVDRMIELRAEDGTYPAVFDVFIEHLDMQKGGTPCTLNAIIVKTYEAWESLLTKLGKEKEAEQARLLGEELRPIAAERFWDGEAGAYQDTIIDGRLEGDHYLCTNAWPLFFRTAAEERIPQVLKHLRKKLESFDPDNERRLITPYGCFYLLGGLYELGECALAEETMRRIYRDMMADPTGTIWEQSHSTKSLVHAWSTAPNYYLSTRVLGVRLGLPDETDLREIVIAPEAESIDRAKGRVPHPLGMVSVEWQVRGGRLFLDYEAPADARVRIEPRGRLAGLPLILNGRPSAPSGKEGSP